MKILHLLSDGPSEMSKKIMDVQSKDNQVKVVDLSKKDVSYDAVVDDIFSNDKVISW